MKLTFAVLALLAAVLAVCAGARLVLPTVRDDAALLRAKFGDFKRTYGRKYASADAEARAFAAFARNVRRAHELNVLHNGSATFGVTKFSDVERRPGALKRGKRAARRSFGAAPLQPSGAIPSVFDWRKKGAVIPPGGGEGQCGGANPAFSAIDNIEGVNFVTNGKLVALSVQEFVACDTYDDGCNGGLMWQMYEWALHDNGGKIYTNASMPYLASNGVATCNTTGAVVGAVLSGFVQITPKDPAAMQQWSYNFGPITTALDATPLQTYTSGVVRASACSSYQIDHAITIVGWNDDTNPPYWICKNTWGRDWGMEGYVFVEKNVNTCGIETEPATAFVQKN